MQTKSQGILRKGSEKGYISGQKNMRNLETNSLIGGEFWEGLGSRNTPIGLLKDDAKWEILKQ